MSPNRRSAKQNVETGFRIRSWSALASRSRSMSRSSVEPAAAGLDGLVGLRRQRSANGIGTIGAHADHPIAVGGAGAWLESLDDCARVAFVGLHARLAID